MTRVLIKMQLNECTYLRNGGAQMAAHSSPVRSTGNRTARLLRAGAITFSLAVGAACVSAPGVADASKGSHHSSPASHDSGSSGKSGGGHKPKTTHTTHTNHHQKTNNATTATKASSKSASNSTLKIGFGATSSGSTTGTHGAKSTKVTSAVQTSTPATETVSTDSAPDNLAGTFAPFALTAVKSPAVTPLPNPLTLVGAAIAYDIRGIEHQMNPLISGVLGVYHLEQGLTELKTLHIIGGSLDLLSAGLSLAIVGESLLPLGSLLIPPTAVLAATTATVDTIGQGLLHW